MKSELIKNIFKNVNTKEKLDNFLKETNDNYCKFILVKKAEPEPTLNRVEIHHIIPLHAGGPKNESWNKIKLSFDDHTHAHLLLSQEYDSFSDKLAYIWRSGLTQEARRLQREYAQTKSVFKDPNMQSKFGKRGGSTWTENRVKSSVTKQSSLLKIAFSNGMIWYIKSKNIFVQANPEQFKLITELVSHLSIFSSKISISNKQNISSICNSISKVITGQSLYAVDEFYLVGIFTKSYKNKNARLTSYYERLLLTRSSFEDKPFLKYSDSIRDIQKSLTKTLNKRSSSTDIVSNLLYPTTWYNKTNHITLKVPPVKTMSNLVSWLENSIRITYTNNQKKQISALIRGGWIGRTREGWTLVEINYNIK